MKRFIIFLPTLIILGGCHKINNEPQFVAVSTSSSSNKPFQYTLHYWINYQPSTKIISSNSESQNIRINVPSNNRFCIAFPELNKSYVFIQDLIPNDQYINFNLAFDDSGKLSKLNMKEFDLKRLTEVASCETNK